jgi:beta-phosphoglucomutase
LTADDGSQTTKILVRHPSSVAGYLMFGFIFDLDGTIVDSTAHSRETWAELLEEFGADDDPEQFLRRSTRDNFRVLLGGEIPDDELEQHVARQAHIGNTKMRAHGVAMHDGIPELLHALKTRGVKLAVATLAERSNAEWTLRALDIREMFDAVVTDQDVQRGKPAPDVYQEALRRLDVKAKHCAVMEDSATGIRAAKSAGLRVIAVVTTHARIELEQAGADKIVTSARELNAARVIEFIETGA